MTIIQGSACLQNVDEWMDKGYLHNQKPWCFDAFQFYDLGCFSAFQQMMLRDLTFIFAIKIKAKYRHLLNQHVGQNSREKSCFFFFFVNPLTRFTSTDYCSFVLESPLLVQQAQQKAGVGKLLFLPRLFLIGLS